MVFSAFLQSLPFPNIPLPTTSSDTKQHTTCEKTVTKCNMSMSTWIPNLDGHLGGQTDRNKITKCFLEYLFSQYQQKKPRYLTSRDNFWCHASCNKRWECKEVVSRQNRNFWKELLYQGYYIISSKILILNLVIQTRNWLASIYLFKVNNKNTRTICEICSKFTL